METKEAIKLRRSVKQYDPEHRMTNQEIEEILSLGMLSPTAFNLQHWRFIVVKDEALRRQVRAAAWDQPQVTDASLLVILCADLKAWEKQPQRYWRNAGQQVQEFVLPAIDSYYRDNERVQRDEAMRSCGMAAQTLMLAAKAMGYDSCPMDGFDFEQVGKLINLPDDHVISLFVAIGKGAEEARPRPGQLTFEEVVIEDRFG
ncbi:nitroreductase family protein [Methylomarinum sp. Ch1-1]|uniref:Nitroreductase family protein n=1 Tax=Methylomarinum roseum TaxID=3067653 RepID=A0AAU7NYY8_9GAMM|nr:nitroreductase family protein [Methylomarinum sp. Ch1-1]MDP4521756.1 nitroreductase family protein [Methylomarinum sp. Ch1-1]